MQLILSSLVPIILLVILGAVLFKWAFVTPQIRGGIDKFTYWVALPSLFVHDLADTDFAALETAGLLLVLVVATVAAAVVAALVALISGLSRQRFGVFVQIGFRGNTAFVGLPLIVFAAGGTDDGLVTLALVALAALVPLNNLIAVAALVMAQQKLTLRTLARVFGKIFTNPLIISAVIGAAIGLLGWNIPAMIDRPLELLGQTALALALVALGGALIELNVTERVGLSIGAALFKVVAVPLITWGFALLFALPADQAFVVMVFAACPSATASYILTTQLGGDDAFAAAGIVISTVLSLPALAVVLVAF